MNRLILGVCAGSAIANIVTQRNHACMNMRLDWEMRQRTLEYILKR